MFNDFASGFVSQSLPLTWGHVLKWLRYLMLIFNLRFAKVKNKPQMPHLLCLKARVVYHLNNRTLLWRHMHMYHSVIQFGTCSHTINMHWKKNWFFNAKNKEIFKFLRRPVDTSTQLRYRAHLILAPSCGHPLDPFRGSTALARSKPMSHHFYLLILEWTFKFYFNY